MRKSRNYLIGLAGIALSLGLAPSAFADGASENTSEVWGGFAPNHQSADTAGPGTLFTQVTTVDADGVANAVPPVGTGPNAVPNKGAERVYIDFDNDFVFNTNKVAKCTADLSTSTSEQAAALCPNAIVGSGQAKAIVPFDTGGMNFIALPLELTVTAFNGPTSLTGGACTAPGDAVGGPEGCEFVGGQPTIRLHAYNPTVPYISVVLGEITNSTFVIADDDGGPVFGKRLAVTDAPDAAGDAGALVLFNSTIGKTTDEKIVKKVKCKSGPNKGKKKCKKTTIKKHHYVTARCQDDGAAKGGNEWDFRAEWIYDDASSDTDTYSQKCNNKDDD
jgi:hypothetical protein